MLSSILSTEIVAAEIFAGRPKTPLLAEEEFALGRAAEKRRREFAIGRSCAHQALARLGLPNTPILIGSNREPLWPGDIVGSITHSNNYYAAAVGYKNRFCSIGIDAELDETLPDGVSDLISIEAERTWIESQEGDGVNWDRVLFSAKESVYKAWFPIMKRWLDFEAVRVTFEPEVGKFRADLCIPVEINGGCRLNVFEGRFLIERGIILTAVSVPQSRFSDPAVDLICPS
jgi:4'-phosphopantetheinyl transferase EntD